jgi:hypothetical protein
MSEQEIQNLESVLLPFAMSRYDAKNLGIAGKFVKSIAGTRIDTIVKLQVQAFIRCLFQVHGTIGLYEMATIVFTEMSYMMNVPPVNTPTFSDRAESVIVLQGEMHRWMLFLQEQNQLPGDYERFTGRFTRN